MKKLLIIILLFQFSSLFWTCLCKQGGTGGEAIAQDQHQIDSLQLQLKNHNATKLELGKNAPVLYDTTAANILNELSKTYINNDPQKAIDYSTQSLKLSQQIGFKKGIGNAYFGLGKSCIQKGDFEQGLDFYRKSLEIRTEINDKIGLGFSLNGIGIIYFNLGSYPLALQNYFAALKIREEINDQNGIAGSYNNIGMIYMMQKSYDIALKYFFNALAINKVTGNKQYHSANLENIGLVYCYLGNFDEAIKHINESINILKEIGNEFYLSNSYLNIAMAYQGKGNYAQALKYNFASLKINVELDDKEGQAISKIGIGTVHVKQGEYKLASEFLGKGLEFAKEIGSLETMKNGYEALASMDSAQGNHKQALAYYKLFIAYRDSIQNTDIANKTASLQLQYVTEKKEQQIIRLTKESQLQQTKLQKQNTTRNVLIVACLLIALLAGVIYNRYRIKQNANAAIEKTMHHLNTTQEQLVEHEKLASLGKFTAEVARKIEVPVKEINQLNKVNRTLILNIKNNNSLADIESLKNNLLQIFNYGKVADAVVKKVLTETRKIQS